MSVLDKLATALNRRDEQPNQALAMEIVRGNDASAVKELVDGLGHKNKAIQSDCIKTLYEIGEQQPKLVAAHVQEFIALLDSSNNRLQWGAMTTLDTLVNEWPAEIYAALGKLCAVAEKGSVITKDHYVGILVKLGVHKEYLDDVLALLNEQILTSAVNQLSTYAEQALPLIDGRHKELFITTFTTRLTDVEQESKRKRLEQTLKKLKTK